MNEALAVLLDTLDARDLGKAARAQLRSLLPDLRLEGRGRGLHETMQRDSASKGSAEDSEGMCRKRVMTGACALREMRECETSAVVRQRDFSEGAEGWCTGGSRDDGRRTGGGRAHDLPSGSGDRGKERSLDGSISEDPARSTRWRRQVLLDTGAQDGYQEGQGVHDIGIESGVGNGRRREESSGGVGGGGRGKRSSRCSGEPRSVVRSIVFSEPVNSEGADRAKYTSESIGIHSDRREDSELSDAVLWIREEHANVLNDKSMEQVTDAHEIARASSPIGQLLLLMLIV